MHVFFFENFEKAGKILIIRFYRNLQHNKKNSQAGFFYFELDKPGDEPLSINSIP